MPRKSPFVIELTPAERGALESTSRRYSASYRDVVRSRIVLLAAAGAENIEIAGRLSLPVQIVSKWRKRFFEEHLAGLAERSRTGRRPGFPPRAGRRGQGDRPVFARIGTTDARFIGSPKCAGHSSATGLRLYYDSQNRPSGIYDGDGT